MNSRAQVEEIYKLCLSEVSNNNANTLTYGEVLEKLGYEKKTSGNAIRHALELLLIACGYHNLPRLSYLIVNKSSGRPTNNAYQHEKWDEELEKIKTFQTWPQVEEIDWEHIWNNRVSLSAQYGVPGYWGNG